MAILFSRVLGFKFIDSANLIVISANGKVSELITRTNFQRKIRKNDRVVIGGFYGSGVGGGVQTFSRGGSDYSGAIVATCLDATIYEIFTDTFGVQTANPAIVNNTITIKELDFTTMYKLSVGGASVLHPDCLPLLKKHAMPLKVDNTFKPSINYTRIAVDRVANKYFCITYKFEQNINKDMVEILCMHSRLNLKMADFRNLLRGTEVYLVSFRKREFTLLAPVSNLVGVVNVLHDYLGKL